MALKTYPGQTTAEDKPIEELMGSFKDLALSTNMHPACLMAPVSKCSADCPPGYRRILNNIKLKCCFDCVQCQEGEISNDAEVGILEEKEWKGNVMMSSLVRTWHNLKKQLIIRGVVEFASLWIKDEGGKVEWMLPLYNAGIKVVFDVRVGATIKGWDVIRTERTVEDRHWLLYVRTVETLKERLWVTGNVISKGTCQKCPEDQWPNDNNQCVLKPVEYLSYTSDPITIVISSISIFFFIISAIILAIFILYRATPIVKANNQTLSFCLLASIMLSFLCVFLFMGRPLHVTCMLRQTSFGIIFSAVVSCILAKVILVYMAFKATKPGCTWRNFISAKLSSSIVIIAALLQVIISTVWLSVSPPFPEANTHIYQDRIILLCNEGSMLAFYVSLAYMGLLAALSLFFAFMSRNLPDSFNEAKNITFSMLVVCSVWVAFIPAYMSVTGKNTVFVEIFAIISSSVGILGCIFFPKCYIILVRPDLNCKSSLLR
ncbi:vomeronasal type-2 receptor 26-like [Dendropsophus ebraccatus]|uniref:vomeronasal type-2 receptor 26-like n=1 Tax=Dendropsophus ebraccatus TaxID=150705 RepID=UPI0038314C3C